MYEGRGPLEWLADCFCTYKMGLVVAIMGFLCGCTDEVLGVGDGGGWGGSC